MRLGIVGVVVFIAAYVAYLDDPNFTAIGHFSSLLIGLCFCPMARGARASAFEASIGSGEAQVRVSPSEIPRGGYLTGVSNESLRSPAN